MSPVACKFCGQPSPDEGPICEECFDRGLHMLPEDLQDDAAAALRTVGTVVAIGQEGYESAGVVLGCFPGPDGEDVWIVRDEYGCTHERPASRFRVAEVDR